MLLNYSKKLHFLNKSKKVKLIIQGEYLFLFSKNFLKMKLLYLWVDY